MSTEGLDIGMENISGEMDHEEINFDIESPRSGPLDLLNLLQNNSSIRDIGLTEPSDAMAESLNQGDNETFKIYDSINGTIKENDKICDANPDDILQTQDDIHVYKAVLGIDDISSHNLEEGPYEAMIPPPLDFSTNVNESAHTSNDLYVRQSKEFSDLQQVKSKSIVTQEKLVLDMVISKTSATVTSDSTCTRSLEISSKTSVVAGEVSLDSIIVSQDSDSEFDFELPPTPVASGRLLSLHGVPQQHAACSITSSSVQAQKSSVATAPRVEHVQMDRTLAQANTSVVSLALQGTANKPVAVIKPTSQTPPKQKFTMIQSAVSVTMDTAYPQHDSNLEAAQDEWDRVNTVQAGFQDSNTRGRGAEPPVVETLKPISMFELTESLKTEDFSKVKASIKCSVEKKGLAAFVNFLFGPPKLHRDLMEERERVFCVAASQLSNENSLHMRTLQTIFRSLTGSKFDCPRLGSHWEEIGFQGNDPATDLRGAGVLGLLNLLFLLKDPKTASLASDIYRLSLHPTQNFPFCVMGINLSRITLQTLREDLLNRECNRRGEVMAVVNEFYAGLYLQLYQVWKCQGKTISDSGYVIKDIETRAKKSPRDVLKHLEDFLNKKTHANVVVDKHDKFQSSGNDNFVNICDDK
ncbi:uncharacterized protein LOC127871082 [Dreissena polymorpha]|uniref:ELMO domain-containing protein n=1 Tax=Dreissena polymorpha TaxID=45954 RepID=A0A9D4LDE1_DREPO|nr:uncharacterized protein LOC127871082 [Dreissena polymorpha]KAH3855754.1 hypothetical protein DPMN_098323 [Dreissena polymorpha]